MMAAKSKIEHGQWWDVSWNPSDGCTKISEGCKYCWAEGMAMRFTGHFNVTLHPERLDQPLHWKKPRRIFVSSMGDLFHEDVEWNFIYKVFERMLLADQHIFIVLTKRSKRMREIMPDVWFHLKRNYPDRIFPLKNVIGMVTAESQAQADKRISDLLQSRFAIRGVSLEPMLGSINIEPYLPQICHVHLIRYCGCEKPPYLNWAIVGAESGANRRECKIEWVRDVVAQCGAAGIPAFVKQLSIGRRVKIFKHNSRYVTHLSKDMADWPEDLRIRQWPE